MSKWAYYNENNLYCVEWLKELERRGMIAPGVVDGRSITEVHADDLREFQQCHFFAGFGGWSRALRLAGWDDHRHVWTGSAPCQPFSTAGTGQGDKDDRHLAPSWLRLLRERRPAIVFGEQVVGAIRMGWVDFVFTEMESMGYACGAADFPSCAVGAYHKRNRVYFVGEQLADADGRQCEGNTRAFSGAQKKLSNGGEPDGFVDGGETGQLGHAHDAGPQRRDERGDGTGQQFIGSPSVGGFWSDVEWLECRDGKRRPTQPGLFPLVDGLSFRVAYGGPLAGRSSVEIIKAIGNAIVPQQAATFIRAYELTRER